MKYASTRGKHPRPKTFPDTPWKHLPESAIYQGESPEGNAGKHLAGTLGNTTHPVGVVVSSPGACQETGQGRDGA